MGGLSLFNMWITARIFRESLLEDIHRVVWMKSHRDSCAKNEKRGLRERMKPWLPSPPPHSWASHAALTQAANVGIFDFRKLQKLRQQALLKKHTGTFSLVECCSNAFPHLVLMTWTASVFERCYTDKVASPNTWGSKSYNLIRQIRYVPFIFTIAAELVMTVIDPGILIKSLSTRCRGRKFNTPSKRW